MFRENGIELEIENNSDQAISDIKFTTSENLNSIDFETINPDVNVSDFLSMKNNKSDGSYILKFTRKNGKRETSGAGYYTNGGSLDSRIIFQIENDTVIAKTSQY